MSAEFWNKQNLGDMSFDDSSRSLRRSNTPPAISLIDQVQICREAKTHSREGDGLSYQILNTEFYKLVDIIMTRTDEDELSNEVRDRCPDGVTTLILAVSNFFPLVVIERLIELKSEINFAGKVRKRLSFLNDCFFSLFSFLHMFSCFFL
jgi:hypothetical protein